jgi:hypothetical protein
MKLSPGALLDFVREPTTPRQENDLSRTADQDRVRPEALDVARHERLQGSSARAKPNQKDAPGREKPKARKKENEDSEQQVKSKPTRSSAEEKQERGRRRRRTLARGKRTARGGALAGEIETGHP